MLIEMSGAFSALLSPFKTQAKTLKKVETIEADMKILQAALADYKDAIKQLHASVRNSASSVSFGDEPALWAAFAGDRYVARNPTFALEVPWIRVAGGTGLWRLRADPDRVKVWARRLSDDGPASVEIIFMVGPRTLHRGAGAELSAYAIDNVIRFVFLMRAVRNCFPSSDFTKIKAYLVSATRSHQSVFVGQRKCASGYEDIGITYADSRDPIPRDYALHDPRPLIVTTDMQVIRTWSLQNEHLRSAAAQQMTMEELEREFSDIVPLDDTTIMSDADIRSWASGNTIEAAALDETPSIEEDGVQVIDTCDGNFALVAPRRQTAPVVRSLVLKRPKHGRPPAVKANDSDQTGT